MRAKIRWVLRWCDIAWRDRQLAFLCATIAYLTLLNVLVTAWTKKRNDAKTRSRKGRVLCALASLRLGVSLVVGGWGMIAVELNWLLISLSILTLSNPPPKQGRED